MNIKDLLDNQVKKLLSEESLTKIQNAFDAKVDLIKEAALKAQDEENAVKLERLIESLDANYASKLKRVYKAVDQDRARKLAKVVKNYQKVVNEQAKAHQKQVVESLDAYLDEFLSETISTEELKAAVRNKSAYNVLSKLRGILSVDSVVMQESVKDAILDGKNKMVLLESENKELKQKLDAIEEKYKNERINNLIEEKIEDFSESKKKFIRKTLKNKSHDFVVENFDYIVRLYDKKEGERIKEITEEAKQRRVEKPDVVIEESFTRQPEPTGADTYLSDLERRFR